MQTIIIINNYNLNNIFFTYPQNNKILHNSKYIKLLYSDSRIILNCMYIELHFNNLSFTKQHNKLLLKFDSLQYFEELKNFEIGILSKYNSNKKHNCELTNKIINQKLICFNNNNSDNIFKIVLKISGIWESDTEIGLTFKIIPIIHQLSKKTD